jgi:Calx-beta domain/Carboxypeptidase regulatory-like domain
MRNIKFFGVIVIFVITFGLNVFAATVTIPATNTNTVSNNKPFGSFFGFERTAAIYTAAEHGITPGSAVTDVCWYVNAVNAPSDVPAVIYMSTTTSTTFTSSTFASEIAGATTVFSGIIRANTLIPDNFRCVALTTPFAYTSNNLKIMVEANALFGGNEGSVAKQFRWSPGASQVWQADNIAPAGNGGISSTRPNIRLMFNPPSGPGTVQFRTSTFSANEGTSAIISVDRVGGSDGPVSVNFATSNGTATSADYTSVSGTLNWSAGDFEPKTFAVPLTDDSMPDQNETIILTLSNPNGTTITGTNPATLTIKEVFRGAYTVGIGGNFPSLTKTGGIFEAINNSPEVGPLVINIISDLTGETGQITLRPIAGNPSVLIKPFGLPRKISGIARNIFWIDGADNITIDGSTKAGGNETVSAVRELTIENQNSFSSDVIFMRANPFLGGSPDPARNNTFKNLIIRGGETTKANVGINIQGADNDNTRIENCQFQRLRIGVASVGGSIENPNLGTVITRNDMSSTGADSIGIDGELSGGIVVINEDGVQVTDNSIGGISLNGGAPFGILVGNVSTNLNTLVTLPAGTVSNALILRNSIRGISTISSFTAPPALGIGVNGGANGANIIANNMISGVIAGGGFSSAPVGIHVEGGSLGSITRLYYNSVSMTGNRESNNFVNFAPSYGVAIVGNNPIVELKNNIISNSQTVSGASLGANAFAVGTSSAVFTNLDADYNLYFPSGTNARGFRSGSLLPNQGTNYANVSLWSNAIGDDINSALIGEVDPLFINPLNNLRIPITSPAVDRGIPVSILDDFDGTIRSAVGFTNGVPDIGADEVPAVSASTASIRGRLITSRGRGLTNAIVTLTNQTTGEIRSVKSTSFGYFGFQDLRVGNTYVLSVSSKRFEFTPQSFRLSGDLNNLILIANQ